MQYDFIGLHLSLAPDLSRGYEMLWPITDLALEVQANETAVLLFNSPVLQVPGYMRSFS